MLKLNLRQLDYLSYNLEFQFDLHYLSFFLGHFLQPPRGIVAEYYIQYTVVDNNRSDKTEECWKNKGFEIQMLVFAIRINVQRIVPEYD